MVVKLGLPKHALALAGFAVMAAAWPGVAGADVKDGVDAWTRGDYAAAVAEWRGPAMAGDADALFNLAQAYRLGQGVPADAAEAERLYAQAAARGHARAADTYGLILFQSGRREVALPYVEAAARRGDPRSQYLLGVAHFNGDLVAKDWTRAYALLTLANAQGLPQAAGALAQMDAHVPIEQRQDAQVLARQLRAEAEAERAQTLAAADLGGTVAFGDDPAGAMPVSRAAPAPTPPVPAPIASVPITPSIVAAQNAVAEAARVTGTEPPATAGADFARPAQTAAAAPAPAPAAVPTHTPAPASQLPRAANAGPWKVQLGAFGVAGNAQKLWSSLEGNPALAGSTRILEPAGRLTKLLAGGFASRADAERACAALKRGGTDCLVVR